MVADEDPAQATTTRKAFVDRFGDGETLILGTHFGGSSAGYLDASTATWTRACPAHRGVVGVSAVGAPPSRPSSSGRSTPTRCRVADRHADGAGPAARPTSARSRCPSARTPSPTGSRRAGWRWSKACRCPGPTWPCHPRRGATSSTSCAPPSGSGTHSWPTARRPDRRPVPSGGYAARRLGRKGPGAAGRRAARAGRAAGRPAGHERLRAGARGLHARRGRDAALGGDPAHRAGLQR